MSDSKYVITRSARFSLASQTGFDVLKRVAREAFGDFDPKDHAGRQLEPELYFVPRVLCKVAGSNDEHTISYLRDGWVPAVIRDMLDAVIEDGRQVAVGEYSVSTYPMAHSVLVTVLKRLPSLFEEAMTTFIKQAVPPVLERVYVSIDIESSIRTANEFGAQAVVPVYDMPTFYHGERVTKGFLVLSKEIEREVPVHERELLRAIFEQLNMMAGNGVVLSPAVVPLSAHTCYTVGMSIASWRNRLVSMSSTEESLQLKKNIGKRLLETQLGCLFRDLEEQFQ